MGVVVLPGVLGVVSCLGSIKPELYISVINCSGTSARWHSRTAKTVVCMQPKKACNICNWYQNPDMAYMKFNMTNRQEKTAANFPQTWKFDDLPWAFTMMGRGLTVNAFIHMCSELQTSVLEGQVRAFSAIVGAVGHTGKLRYSCFRCSTNPSLQGKDAPRVLYEVTAESFSAPQNPRVVCQDLKQQFGYTGVVNQKQACHRCGIA